MAAEKVPGYHPDGTPDVDEVERRILDGADRELAPGRTVHFDIKGSRAGKAVTGLVVASAVGLGVKGGVDTLGPMAEELGAKIAQGTPESEAEGQPHGVGGPSTDEVRESVTRTRAQTEAPSPTDARE